MPAASVTTSWVSATAVSPGGADLGGHLLGGGHVVAEGEADVVHHDAAALRGQHQGVGPTEASDRTGAGDDGDTTDGGQWLGHGRNLGHTRNCPRPARRSVGRGQPRFPQR